MGGGWNAAVCLSLREALTKPHFITYTHSTHTHKHTRARGLRVCQNTFEQEQQETREAWSKPVPTRTNEEYAYHEE